MHRGYPAEAFEAADVAAGLTADVRALFVVVRAEVVVGGIGVRQQGVEDGQDGVAGGDEGFLFGHALDKPPVFRAEEGLGAAGADADLAEGSEQVGVAAAGGVASFAFAAGLGDLGAPSGPGHQVGGGGEDGHVHTDLGDHVLGADAPGTVHGVKLGDLVQVQFASTSIFAVSSSICAV